MKQVGRFTLGSGKYVCSECGKLTRDTGAGEAGCGVCKFCYEGSEYLNAVNDGDETLETIPAKYRKFVQERL